MRIWLCTVQEKIYGSILQDVVNEPRRLFKEAQIELPALVHQLGFSIETNRGLKLREIGLVVCLQSSYHQM